MITSDQQLLLPDLTDNRNVPLAFSDFAATVESRLVKRYASTSDRALRNPTPTEGELSYLTDSDRYEYYTGAAWTTLLPAVTPVGDTVATSQTSSSVAYADLATVGPTVSVTTRTAATVTITCSLSNAGGNHAYMSFAVSGVSTLAAADSRALFIPNTNLIRMSASYLVTGLTAGVNVFTAKYRVSANTGTWSDRNIFVTPAP